MWLQNFNKNESIMHVVLSPAFFRLKTFFLKLLFWGMQKYHKRFVVKETRNLGCTVGRVPEPVSFQPAGVAWDIPVRVSISLLRNPLSLLVSQYWIKVTSFWKPPSHS